MNANKQEQEVAVYIQALKKIEAAKSFEETDLIARFLFAELQARIEEPNCHRLVPLTGSYDDLNVYSKATMRRLVRTVLDRLLPEDILPPPLGHRKAGRH